MKGSVGGGGFICLIAAFDGVSYYIVINIKAFLKKMIKVLIDLN